MPYETADAYDLFCHDGPTVMVDKTRVEDALIEHNKKLQNAAAEHERQLREQAAAAERKRLDGNAAAAIAREEVAWRARNLDEARRFDEEQRQKVELQLVLADADAARRRLAMQAEAHARQVRASAIDMQNAAEQVRVMRRRQQAAALGQQVLAIVAGAVVGAALGARIW
jgi:hypothetical protein